MAKSQIFYIGLVYKVYGRSTERAATRVYQPKGPNQLFNESIFDQIGMYKLRKKWCLNNDKR